MSLNKDYEDLFQLLNSVHARYDVIRAKKIAGRPRDKADLEVLLLKARQNKRRPRRGKNKF